MSQHMYGEQRTPLVLSFPPYVCLGNQTQVVRSGGSPLCLLSPLGGPELYTCLNQLTLNTRHTSVILASERWRPEV